MRIGLAMSLWGETEVTADGEPLLLPPDEAARWKPDERHWIEYLGPAPGLRSRGLLELELPLHWLRIDG
jgi:hypothetical protein